MEEFIDKNGDYLIDYKKEKGKSKKQINDDSQLFSTAEMIDISQGVDSDNK